MRHKARVILILFLCLAGALPLGAQRYRPVTMYAGIKGGLNGSILHYTELNDQQQTIRVSGDAGLFVESRFFDKLSVGMDVSYAWRRTQLEFNTPYLISYSTTAVTNITYSQSLSGLEGCLPVTWYFGKPKTWLENYGRCYVFAGPSGFVLLDGTLEWTRTHLDDNQVIDHHQIPVSTSSSHPYDFGIKAGFGVTYRQRTRYSHIVIKSDVSFYYGLSDSFSDAEKNLTVTHFYGLGDVQHEVLGQRYLRQIKLSFSLALPLRKRLEDACRIMDNF